jgi:hypothetical protein
MQRYDPLEAPDPEENGWRWMSKNAFTLRGTITAARVFTCRM